jgi:hypothetical protein
MTAPNKLTLAEELVSFDNIIEHLNRSELDDGAYNLNPIIDNFDNINDNDVENVMNLIVKAIVS